VLYSFGAAPDGQGPEAGLIQATDGNFYGTTNNGGANGGGTVFKLTPAGAETVLWSFAGSSDGDEPECQLLQGSDGNFYGVTFRGGANNQGTVFKVTPAGVETVLWTFGSGTDGQQPIGGLVEGSDGNFYGTTSAGGTTGSGTVFKITPAGVETVLYSFGSSAADGYEPQAALTKGSDGNFYGTTLNGGANAPGYGTVFKITPAGAYTSLYSFAASSADGENPFAGLILGTDGNFYGTTRLGGTSGGGTVFKITPAGVETVLWSFGGTGDGSEPYANMVQGSDGNFYGTTYKGGANNEGTIFELTPAGVETVVHSFGSSGDGTYPFYSGLIQGTNGSFYGTTSAGGVNNDGTVFKF
jgi:uncharacterized repeat protein (TIGR03803 family)